MRHTCPVGIPEQHIAHVAVHLQGRDFCVGRLAASKPLVQMQKWLQRVPAFAHKLPVQKPGKLPRHEKSAPKQIGASIAASIFEETRVLRRGISPQDRCGYVAQCFSDGRETGRKAKTRSDSRYLAETWIAAEQFVSPKSR